MTAVSSSDWPCVVLGVGGVGSAALYHLARQGIPALGIERFAPGHDRGSSHGQTRVIRMAYFEHPAYVPMLRRAYALWRELEREAGRRLFHTPGVLQVGPPDGEVLPGVLRAARAHGLPVELLAARQVEDRFPGLRVPPGMEGVFEADAGYLDVEACVRAHADLAVARGATLWSGTEVTGWEPGPGGSLRLHTSRGAVTTRRLLVAAGPWAASPRTLPGLDLSLRVLRKTLHWYGTRAPFDDAPIFLYELPGGRIFYGFPAIDGAVKVAEHSGGAPVADPLQVDRQVVEVDRAPVEAFLEQWVPAADPAARRGEGVCLYTMSPDGHFRIGAHPRYPQVRYVAGLSGHGFKFTAMLGELLSGPGDLVDPLSPR